MLLSGAICAFSYSRDGKEFHLLGREFRTKPGKWVGAKIGLLAEATNDQSPAGFADFDWIRFDRMH